MNTCIKCGSVRVVPIIYGKPGSEDILIALEEGIVESGSCCIEDGMSPDFRCKSCGTSWRKQDVFSEEAEALETAKDEIFDLKEQIRTIKSIFETHQFAFMTGAALSTIFGHNQGSAEALRGYLTLRDMFGLGGAIDSHQVYILQKNLEKYPDAVRKMSSFTEQMICVNTLTSLRTDVWDNFSERLFGACVRFVFQQANLPDLSRLNDLGISEAVEAFNRETLASRFGWE